MKAKTKYPPSKGFGRNEETKWTWVSPEEIQRKRQLVSMYYTPPNPIKFCYNKYFYAMFFPQETEWGTIDHLMIAQYNGRCFNNHWATLQQIKNELMGAERLAIEVYPPESELVDACNAYHLWVFPEGFKLPFGLHNTNWSNK